MGDSDPVVYDVEEIPQVTVGAHQSATSGQGYCDIKKARKSREDEGHDGSPRKEGRNREAFRATDCANSIAA